MEFSGQKNILMFRNLGLVTPSPIFALVFHEKTGKFIWYLQTVTSNPTLNYDYPLPHVVINNYSYYTAPGNNINHHYIKQTRRVMFILNMFRQFKHV